MGKPLFYTGQKTCCAFCGHRFTRGELVIHYREADEIFCCRGETKREQIICAALWMEERGLVADMICVTFQGDQP